MALLSVEGRLIEANETALRFGDVEAGDIVGQPFWKAPWWKHSPKLQQQIRAAATQCANGELARFEATCFSADGVLRNVDFSLKPVMNECGDAILLIAEGRDITERKATESALRRSEAELRSFANNSPFGIFRSSSEQDRFLSANPALVRMLGYESEQEVLSLRISTDVYVNPSDRRSAHEKLLHNGIIDIDAPCKRKDGTRFTAHLHGRLVQELSSGQVFEAIVEDVTERKRAEQALSESEERFRRVVEGAPVGMYIQTDGIFRYFNPAATVLFGADSADQLVGKGFLELIHPDSRPAVIERAHAVLEERTAVPFLEERLLRLDGSMFHAEVTAVPYIFEGRNGALVFVRDITERKLREANQRVLEQQLLEVQKMESIGRLAGGIAHDFNNLLMIIQSYTELLQGGLASDSDLRLHAEQILKAADRGCSLTSQMLAFSRKQIITPVLLNLEVVIKDTVKMLGRLIGEHIELRVEAPASLWTIRADSNQMVQLLMNLCVNARDAMPGGGTLTITAENYDVIDRVTQAT
jgi:PAS domain S-box-containing protein